MKVFRTSTEVMGKRAAGTLARPRIRAIRRCFLFREKKVDNICCVIGAFLMARAVKTRETRVVVISRPMRSTRDIARKSPIWVSGMSSGYLVGPLNFEQRTGGINRHRKEIEREIRAEEGAISMGEGGFWHI